VTGPRYDDPRVLAAGNEAFGAVVRAAGYLEAHGLTELPSAAAKLIARPRVWAAAVRAGLLHPTERGFALGAEGPAEVDAPAPPSAPRAPLSAAERARAYRARRHVTSVTAPRDDAPASSRDERHGAVTKSVTASRDGRAPLSLSSAGNEATIQAQRETRAPEPSRDERHGVTLVSPAPGYGEAPPDYVATVVAQYTIGRGISLDGPLEWAGYLAHCRGEHRPVSEDGFRLWFTRSVKRAESDRARGIRGGRQVQRDPPGPKAYEVAHPDDEWTERTSP